jgi:RHS repeat-associated protein
MQDGLGSTTGLVNPSQKVQEADVYDAFGNLTYRSSSGTLTFPTDGESVMFGGADGYQTDNDSGLIRCGNRYYNPYFGRFITQDPIGDGDNWYAYCGNNPIDKTDKTGLVPVYDSDSQQWVDIDSNGNQDGTYSQDSNGNYTVLTLDNGEIFDYNGTSWAGTSADGTQQTFDNSASPSSGQISNAQGVDVAATLEQDAAVVATNAGQIVWDFLIQTAKTPAGQVGAGAAAYYNLKGATSDAVNPVDPDGAIGAIMGGLGTIGIGTELVAGASLTVATGGAFLITLGVSAVILGGVAVGEYAYNNISNTSTFGPGTGASSP